jgi:hypothetical protein
MVTISLVDPAPYGSTLIFGLLDPVPDPHWECGSGSEKKKVKKFHVLKCWMLSFESWRLLR